MDTGLFFHALSPKLSHSIILYNYSMNQDLLKEAVDQFLKQFFLISAIMYVLAIFHIQGAIAALPEHFVQVVYLAQTEVSELISMLHLLPLPYF